MTRKLICIRLEAWSRKDSILKGSEQRTLTLENRREQQKKMPRGGYRPGAGRPRGRAPRQPEVNFKCTEEDLKRWCHAVNLSKFQNRSEWIRDVLDKDYERLLKEHTDTELEQI